MLCIEKFTFNHFEENTYIIWDNVRFEGYFIDPGCYSSEEKNVLKKFVSEKNITPVGILNTHCHIDHVVGNHFLKSTYNIPIKAHVAEKEVLSMAKVYSDIYGFGGFDQSEIDCYIGEKDLLKLGNEEIKIYYVPGHSPGHLAFVHEASQTIISGDVLFFESIGRTDLPLANAEDLFKSIKNVLYALPVDFVVWPGHGIETTIGHEVLFNPYVKK